MSGPPGPAPGPPPGPPSGPPEYGYGGQPPYGPPARRNNRNVVIAVAGVVIVAAAAIISIVALSGGDTKPSAASSISSTPTSSAAAPTTSTSSVPTGSTGAAPTSAAPTTATPGALTCADIEQASVFAGKLTLHEGGTKPADVKLAAGEPDLTCSGVTQGTPSAAVTALAWNSVQLTDYVTQLTSAGWSDAPKNAYHVLSNANSKYTIVAVTINGSLVAVYGHS